MDEVQHLKYVSERDIDLLLLEEFHVPNPSVVSHLAWIHDRSVKLTLFSLDESNVRFGAANDTIVPIVLLHGITARERESSSLASCRCPRSIKERADASADSEHR